MNNSKNLLLATTNANKIEEIKNLLKNTKINIQTAPKDFNPIENGTSFMENAYIKAENAATKFHTLSLADDSGLVINALNGKPGIYSARYANDDQSRINRVLTELNQSNTIDRSAKFVCAMALVNQNKETLYSCIGECCGLIVQKQTGTNGFGYDPIFFIPELNKTMAELSMDEKNKISHRSKALNLMINWIRENL